MKTPAPTPCAARPGRSYTAVLVYLAAFALLLVVVLKAYLLPTLRAAETAGPEERKRLAAGALLVLMVLLFVLGAGLILTFRVGRFFLPRALPQRKRTQYVDAWAESARRLDVPPDEPEQKRE